MIHVTFGNQTLDISGIRRERLINRSSMVNLMAKKDEEINIVCDAISPAAMEMFNDFLDMPTVWDFIIKYRFRKAKDMDPYRFNENYPENVVMRTRAIDDFMFQVDEFFNFYWIKNFHNETDDDVRQISRHYLEKCDKNFGEVNGRYIVLVPDASKYLGKDGRRIPRYISSSDIPTITPYPYRDYFMYEYLMKDKVPDSIPGAPVKSVLEMLAEEERGLPEHENEGIVSFHWDKEFASFIKGYKSGELLLPRGTAKLLELAAEGKKERKIQKELGRRVAIIRSANGDEIIESGRIEEEIRANMKHIDPRHTCIGYLKWLNNPKKDYKFVEAKYINFRDEFERNYYRCHFEGKDFGKIDDYIRRFKERIAKDPNMVRNFAGGLAGEKNDEYENDEVYRTVEDIERVPTPRDEDIPDLDNIPTPRDEDIPDLDDIPTPRDEDIPDLDDIW